MRVRLKELLAEREMTVYALAKAVSQRGVSEQAVYRLARVNGAPKRFDMRLLSALCDVFGVEPGELWERDKAARQRRSSGA